MIIEDIILNHLKTYKKRTIPLSQLENLLLGNESYEDFTSIIEDLMDRNILKPIKSHGKNGKPIQLYNTYRIMKSNLRQTINNEIQYYNIKFNSHINLDSYFSLGEKEWYKDLPYIKKIDFYLTTKGLPLNYVTVPERSFQLVADEKWIDEKGGKKLLERIKLWDKLKITTNPDPLMLAINPLRFKESRHIHLAVENKATFYALIDIIKETCFTSLVYGAGWKVVANIHSLSSQLGLKDDLHKIYYFGDIDAEGISIWNSLYEKHKVELAIPFYKTLLEKEYSIGKETQQKNKDAIRRFKNSFSNREVCIIDELIDKKAYLPQEGLKKEELEDIWRKELWEFP